MEHCGGIVNVAQGSGVVAADQIGQIRPHFAPGAAHAVAFRAERPFAQENLPAAGPVAVLDFRAGAEGEDAGNGLGLCPGQEEPLQGQGAGPGILFGVPGEAQVGRGPVGGAAGQHQIEQFLFFGIDRQENIVGHLAGTGSDDLGVAAKTATHRKWRIWRGQGQGHLLRGRFMVE